MSEHIAESPSITMKFIQVSANLDVCLAKTCALSGRGVQAMLRGICGAVRVALPCCLLHNWFCNPYNQKSTAYNELATAHHKQSTAYNGKKALQEDSTAYNDLTSVHNEKSTAYNENTTA